MPDLSQPAETGNATAYTVEPYDSEPEWKRARIDGVGASEGAAVVGLSQYCGEFGLYWRKQEGRFEDDDPSAGFAEMQDAGHRHEPTISAWFLEQHAHHGVRDVHDPGDFTIFRSTERPHVFCTPDRVCLGDLFTTQRPLELKCAWYEAAKVWRERIPIAYQVQLQQTLYVTGADEGYFAVLLDGYRFKWFRMQRHEKFIARLMARIDAFWDRVQRRDPPPVDGSRSSLWALLQAHPKGNGQAVDVPDDLGAQWDALQQAESAASAKRDELKARLQQMMGDATWGQLGDGTGWRWNRNGKTARFERVEKVRSDEQ